MYITAICRHQIHIEIIQIQIMKSMISITGSTDNNKIDAYMNRSLDIGQYSYSVCYHFNIMQPYILISSMVLVCRLFFI